MSYVIADPHPLFLTVGGQRFSCPACGSNMFRRIRADIFACNGCNSRYLGANTTEQVGDKNRDATSIQEK